VVKFCSRQNFSLGSKIFLYMAKWGDYNGRVKNAKKQKKFEKIPKKSCGGYFHVCKNVL